MRKVKLTSICSPKQWKTIPTADLLADGYPVYGANGVIGFYDKYNHENKTIAITCRGATCGTVNLTCPKAYITGNAMCLDDLDNEVGLEYLFYAMKAYDFSKIISGSAQPQITRQGLEKVEVLVYPEETQKQIVRNLQNVDSLITSRREQLAKLDELVKSRFIELLNDSEKEVRLDDLISPYKAEKCGNNTYPVLSITMRNGLMLQSDRFKKEIASGDKSQYKVVPRNKLVVAFPIDEGLLSAQTIVDAGIVSPAYNLYSIDESKVMPKVLEYILRSDKSIQYYLSKLQGTTLRRRMIPKEDFYSMPVQLPTIDRQKQFLSEVNQIDKSKFEIQQSLEKLETLKKALMQKYFG